MDDDIKKEHPSFVMLEFSRTTSNIGKHLFGSSIKHSNTIHMRIKRCEENRGLNRYWYYGKENLIEIEMSYSQFAEAITNMNTQGIPVTMRYLMGEKIEEPPGESQRELFEREFKDKVQGVGHRMRHLKKFADEMLETKGAMKVADKKKLAGMLHMLCMEVDQNLPFIQKSYNEAMDKTTMEAKIEIEAFMQHEVVALGIEAFKRKHQLPDDYEVIQLVEGETKDDDID